MQSLQHYTYPCWVFDNSLLFLSRFPLLFYPNNFLLHQGSSTIFSGLNANWLKHWSELITKWSLAWRKNQCITMRARMEGAGGAWKWAGSSDGWGYWGSACVCGGRVSGRDGKIRFIFFMGWREGGWRGGEGGGGLLGSVMAPHCILYIYRWKKMKMFSE